MRRSILLGVLLGVLLVACTSSLPDPGQPAKSIEPPPAKPDTEREQPTPSLPIVSSDACGQQITDYLAQRAELSGCNSDSDCAEMWPGLCPHGPYYIHRDADVGGIIDLERAIMASCTIPECEPPMELGIAHCEAGKCASGRAAPMPTERIKHIKYMSCWDYRETWLEADGSATATASSMLQGITPYVAIAPAAAGVLVLEVNWPADCVNCRLWIFEHTMSQLIVAKSTRTNAKRNGMPIVRERLELPVKPGPYRMVGMADADANYTIRADLRDAAGARGRVTRHGVGWQRMCEG
jgi:hypothetical protein